ncbi:hypothetical protein GOP47_0018010 [Adiantum capillus-veneris]|uniref:Myotubularin phosphatase domain-containing protein n=1 Tax=Adiantum capillus-veneris TaxID=13818 RepID=A0A9D4UGZ0_ADICA|nr:hypothetical protein GOP47_0018010 [Adiantum capillus-veneris]
MDGSESWLDWTSVEVSVSQPISGSFSHGMEDLLLPDEGVIAEGRGVVLVNLDIAGTLLVTNYRLLFVSEGQRKVVPLGTIPVATIEKFSKQPQPLLRTSQAPRAREKATLQRLLQVVGKDMRIILFGFRPRTRQRRAVWESLMRVTKPAHLWDLYAFTSSSSAFRNTDSRVRLHAEYLRLLHLPSSRKGYGSFISDGIGLTDMTQCWRICEANSSFTLSPTYPHLLIVPSSISDEEVQQAAAFRARARLPVVSWRHSENGAVLARSSQPLVGIMLNNRSNADERLVEALCLRSKTNDERRKLYIADARPRKNALANGAMGGGSESSSNYFQCEVVFLGIENIHSMRDSLARLRDYLDTHGAASSDGSSSLLRSGGLAWGGGNLSNMAAAVSALGDSGWLVHVHNVLAAAAWVAARIALEEASVLVHCSDGWDRTAQIVALAELMLDPYYRTFRGFQALIEKDWLAFGHPFADRLGMPTYNSSNNLLISESVRQSSGQNISSPVRLSQGSGFTSSLSHNAAASSNNFSPIFLQWIDCVSQLLRLYPRAFEFSSAFLVEILDCVLSCRFGNFLCNSEKERFQAGISESCGCMWVYLEKQRHARGKEHEHFNIFYDREYQDGALLPPAAALAPTLWPNYFLRWACPSEINAGGRPISWVQGGELENQCRMLVQSYTGFKKAKDRADIKVRELSSRLKLVSEELRTEKQASSSTAAALARLQKENNAINRALLAIGCKVRFSESSAVLGASSSEDEETSNQEGIPSASRAGFLGANLEDLAVSVSVASDSDLSADLVRRPCGEACDSENEEGCRWPASGCARLGSGFAGIRANFSALENLSIDDSYFEVGDDLKGQPYPPPEIT